VLASLAGLTGGFRSFASLFGLVFLIQFFLEGMHRTKLLPIFGMLGIALALVILPQASRLPLTIQRSLAFLPLSLDPQAASDAKGSWDWRVEIWKAAIRQIPKYLLLGKGYGFSADDYQFMGSDSAFHPKDPLQGGLGLSMDYHNGWISILMTFGLWGMIAFLWFSAAGINVLYCNYRYGDPELRAANAFLLASFVARFLLVMTVSGLGLHADLVYFAGFLGLSVSLNGGVCRRPAFQPVAVQKPSAFIANPFPQPRRVFQR
jgi:O-antigen ligase